MHLINNNCRLFANVRMKEKNPEYLKIDSRLSEINCYFKGKLAPVTIYIICNNFNCTYRYNYRNQISQINMACLHNVI